MNSFEAYIMYRAMKLHFTTARYDFNKYRGEVSGSVTTFKKRNDKYMFDQLSKRKDPKLLLIAVLSEHPKDWIGDILRKDSLVIDLQKRIEALGYFFEQEILHLNDDFKSEFIIINNEHPPILKKVLNKEISKETLIILDDIMGFMPYWRKEIKETMFFPDFDFKLTKYRCFLPKYNKEKIIEKMQKRWKNQLTI